MFFLFSTQHFLRFHPPPYCSEHIDESIQQYENDRNSCTASHSHFLKRIPTISTAIPGPVAIGVCVFYWTRVHALIANSVWKIYTVERHSPLPKWNPERNGRITVCISRD